MIFLDANILLRFLTTPESPKVALLKQQAVSLLGQVHRGEIEATTSEVVIHETCYVLRSSAGYGRPVDDIVARVKAVLGWPGMVLAPGEQEIYMRALDLWAAQHNLGFADAVIAARCERAGHELATFDGHFKRIPTVTLWKPEADTA